MWTILASAISAVCVGLVLACSSSSLDETTGSGDDPGQVEEDTCAGFVSSLSDCGVATGTRFPGCEDDHPVLPCLTGCARDASCDEIEGAYCDLEENGFRGCVAECEAALPPPEFLCDDGSAVPLRWQCDGARDCPTGEDEDCPQGTFACEGGLDIPAGWRCDGVDDCPAGDDELDCNGITRTCNDGTALPASQECDGVADCAGGEDELECTLLTCR